MGAKLAIFFEKSKKVKICLSVIAKMLTFAAEIQKRKRMNSLNLIGNLIIIRLRSVVGSDKACI